MSYSRGSPAVLIGFFFLLALTLLLAAIIFLSTDLKGGKGDSFFILCFDGSLNGLEAGAPVKFRGVRVGSVEKISVSYNPEESTAQTPVIIKIDPDFLDCCPSHEKGHKHDILIGSKTAKSKVNFYKEQIAKGLSAKLSMESFLTGKLFIELDYYDDRRKRQLIPVYHADGQQKLPQIPTVYSDIDRFMRQVERINLPLLLEHADNCLLHLDAKIQGFAVDTIIKMVQEFSQFSHSANEVITSETLKQGLIAMQDTFTQSSQALKKWNNTFPELKTSIEHLLQHASVTIKGIQDGVASTFDEDSSLQRGILQALKNFSDMVYKVQSFIDYLDRNPNAILAGKQP
jgi:paraquat-inducible protein B